jgi:alpha-L-fucosidase
MISVLAAASFIATQSQEPPLGPMHPLLKDTVLAGPYKPNWDSIGKHPLPEWFQNDKIGLSAHWGPYAVPGWTAHKDSPYGVAYAEWYRQWMDSNPVVKQYHEDTYGGVHYDTFINGAKNLTTSEVDGFFTEDFDADKLMKFFADSGVKYFFITAKHHDGFCLWDSKYTDRNAAKMGPKRDLLRELTDAARANGLKIGFYYSYYEWHNPSYTAQQPGHRYDGYRKPADVDGDGVDGEYVDDFMIPQIKELIDNYQPDYLCFDGEWDHGYVYWRSRQITAYYFNQAAKRGQQVLINDRFGGGKEGTPNTRGVYGDFYHVEYVANIDRTKPWAMWRGFGNSYGYNRNEAASNILSIKDTLKMMVDVVADGGNVEFNLGPKADGTLADFEVERIAAMGQWLAVNGQSIYGAARSPVKGQEGVQFTHRADLSRLYVHVYDWPTSGRLVLDGLGVKARSAILLATNQTVNTEQSAGGSLVLNLPGTAPDPNVSVIAVDYEGSFGG